MPLFFLPRSPWPQQLPPHNPYVCDFDCFGTRYLRLTPSASWKWRIAEWPLSKSPFQWPPFSLFTEDLIQLSIGFTILLVMLIFDAPFSASLLSKSLPRLNTIVLFSVHLLFPITATLFGLCQQCLFQCFRDSCPIYFTQASHIFAQLNFDSASLHFAGSLLWLGLPMYSSWWSPLVSKLVSCAACKVSFPFRTRCIFIPDHLLLCKAQIGPTLEYYSDVRGETWTTDRPLLDRIQREAVRLINDPLPTSNLHSLAHRQTVTSDIFP